MKNVQHAKHVLNSEFSSVYLYLLAGISLIVAVFLFVPIY